MTDGIFRYRMRGVRTDALRPSDPVEAALRDLALPPEDLVRAEVLRESLDARCRNRPVLDHVIELETRRPLHGRRLEPLPPQEDPDLALAETLDLPGEVHVVGTGPCGMACAIHLARRGFRVILHERGQGLTERSRLARALLLRGEVDPETNLLFGEGGAGTFTDGKLNTRQRGALVRMALSQWVEGGADPKIMRQAKPHLGTDRMRLLVSSMRRMFLEGGGILRLGSRLEDIEIRDSRITGAVFSGVRISCEALVLAIGHSARDTLSMLKDRGVAMESKDFAMGVRVEHPQEIINRARLGTPALYKALGAAEYFLSCARPEAPVPGAHSFCMCPGGVVVPTSTDTESLATNGMSFHARAGTWANAGLVTPLDTAHRADLCRNIGLDPSDPMASMKLQEHVERICAQAGGGGLRAPAQTTRAFLDGRIDRSLPPSSYRPGLEPRDLSALLPDVVVRSLRMALESFEAQIPGFRDGGLMIAPETRTSSPVRLPRDRRSLDSVGVRGLYPLGEGAGWSGGIVTSAADGLRLAVRARSPARPSCRSMDQMIVQQASLCTGSFNR